MRIEHAALYCRDLEAMKTFYTVYFGGQAGEKYKSAKRSFSSYFISFDDGARLEIMSSPDITAHMGEALGFSHIAFELKNKDAVGALTKKLAESGVRVVSGPRTTGDGYYESCVLDPEGNRVELTCPK